MELRPIPAFYCCYLLRSTVHHASLYIGSTPNPVRRLAQHNGASRGGASRTSRQNLRPWEMTCIVSGFPSQVAALQFEWAWQNPHATRHIPSDERLAHAITLTKVTKSGHVKKRQGRPRASLSSRLANLHLLLRVNAFSRWPLEVRFFSGDVYKAWQKWVDQSEDQMRDGVIVKFEPETDSGPDLEHPATSVNPERPDLPNLLKGIQALDVDFKYLKPVVEKSSALFGAGRSVECVICHQSIPHSAYETALVCPGEDCEGTYHLTCLSEEFLQSSHPEQLVPINGSCPKCNSDVMWKDIIQESTLRARDPAIVSKLLKSPRAPKKAARKMDIQELTNDESLPEEQSRDLFDAEIEALEHNEASIDELEPRLRTFAETRKDQGQDFNHLQKKTALPATILISKLDQVSKQTQRAPHREKLEAIELFDESD